MAITINGTTGINSTGGYTGDGISFADGTPSNTLVTTTDGNVGIGTSSPTQVLDVVRTTATSVYSRFKNSATPNGLLVGLSAAGDTLIYNGDATNIALYTNGLERVRVDTSGDLRAANGIALGNMAIDPNGGFFISGTVVSAGAGTFPLKWNNASGFVTYDTSSRLVKNNIVDSPYGLAEVMQLKSRKYFRVDDERNEIGFVADEIVDVMPEFVPMVPKSVFTKIETDTDLIAGGVNYEKMVSVLTKAIQEQQALITQLQADVAALQGATP